MTTELRDQMARDQVDCSVQSPQVFLRHAWHKRIYRVPKCDVTKKYICEIMGFGAIFK